MAKSTAEQAAITRQSIIDTALAISLETGFEDATLGNIAKRLGMSRSGINCHFKHKSDLAKAVEPMLSKIIFDMIDFSSCDTFHSSWVSAVESSSEFRSCIVALGPVVPTSKGFDGMRKLIGSGDDEDKAEVIYRALGYAMVYIDRLYRESN